MLTDTRYISSEDGEDYDDEEEEEDAEAEGDEDAEEDADGKDGKSLPRVCAHPSTMLIALDDAPPVKKRKTAPVGDEEEEEAEAEAEDDEDEDEDEDADDAKPTKATNGNADKAAVKDVDAPAAEDKTAAVAADGDDDEE